MKIVFLAPFGIRPKGTLIARMLPMAAELQKLGHTVVIVAPPYTNPEDSGITEMVRGVKLVNIPLINVGKSLGALPMAWRMFRAALVEKPDLVHLFKPKGYGGLAAMLMYLLKRVGFRMPPLFVDTDDWEGEGGMNDLHAYSWAEKRLFAFQEQWLSRHATGVSVASHELQRLTEGLGVAPELILYLPNCVEDMPPGDGARIRERLGILPGTPLLLLYTRFFEFTQDRLHRVLSGIYESVTGVRFLVVGMGRHGEEEQLLSAAGSMGFSDALIMAGWLKPQEIPDYLAAADVAIYPLDDTLVNRAKCPAKLTEIIRSGVPVVADRVGQVLEYVSDETLLSNPVDPDEMIKKTAALLQDKGHALAAAAAARSYLLERFVWNRAVHILNLRYCNT